MPEIKKSCGGEIPTATILGFIENTLGTIGGVASQLVALSEQALILKKVFTLHTEHCEPCRAETERARAEQEEFKRIAREKGPLEAIKFMLERAAAQGKAAEDEWPSTIGGGENALGVFTIARTIAL